jgi:WD40 repeat protein
MRPNIAVLMLLCCLPTTVLAQSARQEKTINLPSGVSVEVSSVSPAGNLIAAICSDHVVRVWSTSSGDLVRSLRENSGLPGGLQFSNDGQLLAVSFETVKYEKGMIKVFDVSSWQVQDDLASECMFCAVRFSPDRRRLANAGNFFGNTSVWDLATQKKVATISPPFGGSSALSFSSDGKLIATADGDGFVRIYNANTGTLRGTPTEFLLEPFAVAFSPDGKSVLAGGADKVISVIDPENGKISRTIPKQSGLVLSLDISGDGKLTAVVYQSSQSILDANHIMLWDLDRGAVLADFQKSGITITGGAFVGDHYVFAAASGNQLTLWAIP